MESALEATIFADWTGLGVTLLVLFGAQVVYALYGFGSGLLSVALLAFVFPDLSPVVSLLLLINLPTELFVLWRDRHALSLRAAGTLLAGIAIGAPVGIYVLGKGGGDPRLFTALALLLIVFGVYFLWEARQPGRESAAKLPRGSALGAGVVSGLLAGLFGTGGPPLILYFRLQGLEKTAFRVTLLTLFLATSAVRVPLSVAGGLVTSATLVSTIVVLPACMAGALIGHRMHRAIPEARFKGGVAVLLALLGALLLLRG